MISHIILKPKLIIVRKLIHEYNINLFSFHQGRHNACPFETYQTTKVFQAVQYSPPDIKATTTADIEQFYKIHMLLICYSCDILDILLRIYIYHLFQIAFCLIFVSFFFSSQANYCIRVVLSNIQQCKTIKSIELWNVTHQFWRGEAGSLRQQLHNLQENHRYDNHHTLQEILNQHNFQQSFVIQISINC